MCELCHMRTAKSILLDWKVRHLHCSLTSEGDFLHNSGSQKLGKRCWARARQVVQPAGIWPGQWREGGHTVRASSCGISLPFKNRTANAGKCPFMLLRKDKSSHNCYYLYSESKKAVTWWDSVSHASRHSNIAPRRQGFHWKFHSNVSLHNLFCRYYKCILTYVQFGFPC